MSVLFKSPSNSIGNIGGGSSTGFPPGDVSNIIHSVNAGKVLIKWQDPDDTVLDEAIFVKWKGTILVRNSDHYPISIKDGDIVIDSTIRNAYKDIWYEDNNLINDHIYYYRFFTYSEDKVYNDSGNLVFKDKPLAFAPILKDNTWEQIANASESGNIPSTWNIGDEIDLVLSGSFNETVTIQIWDFNHFDKSDGSGKAGICFGMKNLMNTKQQMNTSATNIGGWNDTYMRNTVMNNIFNSMPADLKPHIKEVNTYANRGGGYSSAIPCTDKIFLPGFQELGWYDIGEGNQIQFPIFTNDASRVKKMSNLTGEGNADYWWTRSPLSNGSYNFNSVKPDGSRYSFLANSRYSICFCFNI